jgi:hypothetical protein
VLLPGAENLLRDAGKQRREGACRIELKLWHGAALLVALAVALGIAEAADSSKESPWLVLVRWMPFILWGPDSILSSASSPWRSVPSRAPLSG